MLISEAQAASDIAQASAPFVSTKFFVGLSFVLFFVIFGKKLLKVTNAALDERSQKIHDQIEEATRLREEAQDLLASYEKKQHEALKEAENIVAAARDEAQRLSLEAAAQLDANLKRAEQVAQDRIAQAEAQAIADVRTLAVDVAIAATKQILTDNISDTKATALVDGAIKNLDGKLH